MILTEKKVGGIPSLSFLIATRLAPHEEQDIDFTHGHLIYPFEGYGCCKFTYRTRKHKKEIRVETAQRVSGENKHWDANDVMDIKTKRNYFIVRRFRM